MKALVLAGANIRHMPYLFFYFEQLSNLKYEITLFYWDRDGLQDRPLPDDVKAISFRKKMKNDISKLAKIKYFLEYRKEALKVIKSQQYDRIIVCDTQFAVLLSDILFKKYKKKYIFDYRDPSFERIGIYKKRVDSVILNSKATLISSKAYCDYLPKCEHIHTTHNILMGDLTKRNIRRLLPRETERIRLAFWGCIRDTEINLSFIKRLANDNRFELHYYGTIDKTAQSIVPYCEDLKINNVFIHGEYLPDQRYDFARSTDIIHNMQNAVDGGNPRMTNKFYDGIIFYLPQICTDGSFMGSETVKYGVGISLDPSISFADALYYYYKNMDWGKFEEKCDKCLGEVFREFKRAQKAIYAALML